SAVDSRLQRSDQARSRTVPGEFRRRVPAAAIARRASLAFGQRTGAMREGTGLRRLQPESRSVGRTLDRAPADGQALVSVLRENGRAGRAGDDSRLGVLQSELPCDRRAL